MKSIVCFALLIIFTSHIYAQPVVTCTQTGKFSNGMLSYLLNDKVGFVNAKGNIVIPDTYRYYIQEWGELPYFTEGFTMVQDPETELIGYLNTRGEVEMPYMFKNAYNFSEEIAFVRIDDHVSLIDSKGGILARDILALNAWHSKFTEGLAGAQKEFAYGFIDKKGNFVIEPAYDEIRDFSQGFAAVKKDGKWGFIDKTGAVRIPFQFSNEPMSFNSGRTFVQSKDNLWGIMDTTGKILVEPKYKQAFAINEGFAVVSTMDAKWQETFYIINADGKTQKEYMKEKNAKETITFWSGFHEGLAVAMKDFKKGMIDPKGKVVIDFLYRELKSLENGMAYFERFDEKTKKVTKGYLTSKGVVAFTLAPPQF
ncbi:MAG: WG repeat-containing protein [Ignavibacteriales bacterium]|nr:MAG: WG repeat-containing protein [Ignavibacteriales bacterium]